MPLELFITLCAFGPPLASALTIHLIFEVLDFIEGLTDQDTQP